jgi:NAD(P)-dependent dehydrogenase (short-subunit alcohol dehydrogenase family)
MSDVDESPIHDYGGLLRLDGRVFVVLGGGYGIGRQVAHALTQVGAKVAVVDREQERAEAVAREVGGLALSGDITRREDVERIFAAVEEQAGPVRGLVDIVGLGHRGPLSSVDDETWRWQFGIVVDHAFLAVQIGAEAIARAGGGSMVFVGSIAGLVTTGDNHPAYGAAKAALHHLVAFAAKEHADRGVRINAVAPGVTITPRSSALWTEQKLERLGELIPRGEPGEPWEIAAPILFLASDLSSYVTAQVLAVDGGLAGSLRLDRL